VDKRQEHATMKCMGWLVSLPSNCTSPSLARDAPSAHGRKKEQARGGRKGEVGSLGADLMGDKPWQR